MKYKVLFIDLDGTLTDTVSGSTFPQGVWDMKLKFDVFDAILRMQPEKVFIVTNQGGIEAGYASEEAIRRKLDCVTESVLEYCKIQVCGRGYSKTNRKDDPLRKPNTGILEYLQQNQNFEKEDCLMVGDASGLPGQFSDSDKKTAENFGIDYMDVSEFVRFKFE